MGNSNEPDSNHIKTGWVIAILVAIVLVVVGFYFIHFDNGLAEKNDVWGQFGDYIGGILNPVIAAFAFYLIAKSYELQKRELEATRQLLEVSTDAQKDQIKLAVLTALLNANLMRIDLLKTEKSELVNEFNKSEKRLKLENSDS
jgi:large-conductance mechanosensitive channel